jgi:hypothetical protein
VSSTALNHTAPGPQHTQVLQVKWAQCVFDGVSQPDDSVLHIASEKNNKGIALPEHLRSSHRTGTAWVIDKILVYLKNSFIVAVQIYIQKVALPPVHPNR